MRIRLLTLALLCAALTLSVGCSRDPKAKSQRYLVSGQRYFDQQEFDKAGIEFRNAVQADPGSGEAYYRLALVELKLRRWPEAYRALVRATQLDPKIFDAHLQLAQLEAAGRQWEDARQELAQALVLDQNNVDAYLLQGRIDSQTHRYEDAIRELETAQRLAPKDPRPASGLGDAYVLMDRYPEAEASYRQAIALDAAFIPGYLSLAQLDLAQGRPDAATAILQQAIQTNPKTTPPYLILAGLYLGRSDAAQAEAVLGDLRKANGDSAEALLAIGDFYLHNNENVRAQAVLLELVSRDPHNDDARKLLIQAHLNLQQLSDAEALNRQALAEHPQDPDARLAEARLLLAHGKNADAIAKLQELVREAPDMATVRFALAVAYDQSGNRQGALVAYKDCLARDPESVAAYLGLADISLQQRDGQTALYYANEALKRNPNLVLARVDRANAQVVLGNLAAAQQDLAALATAQPDDVVVQEHQAIARLRQQIQRVPEQSDFYELLGITYLEKNDPANAEEAFQQAVSLNPDAYLSHAHLARIYAAQQKFPEAIVQARSSIQRQPAFLAGYIMLGNLYEQTGEWDSARQAYLSALQQNPNFSLALNNLAWLYCEHGGNLDEALELARRAKQSTPDDPQVSDTLAWIEYHKGMYDSAATLLRDAVRRAPRTAVYQYHLGMTLWKSGKRGGAKAELRHALDSDLSPADAEQARLALEDLNHKQD
jgi:tetratricopeptide (TPR) repeat protein